MNCICLSSACEEGQGVCAHLMVIGSILLIFVTLPFSLMFVVKVVQVTSLYYTHPNS